MGLQEETGLREMILELIMSMDLDEETGMPKIRNKILVKGREFYFVDEFDSEDEIQQNFVWYQMQNILVYCLPINDKHRL